MAPVGGQAISSQPQPAISENGDALVAWLQSAGEPASVHGRFFHEALPAGDGTLSNPALGGVDPAAGLRRAAANRIGDMAVAFVQGSGTERRIVAGAWDRAPSVFTANTTTHWRRPQPLKWSGSIDRGGRSPTRCSSTAGPPPRPPARPRRPRPSVPEGFHRWRVVAADRRGQKRTTKLRELRVDGTPPLIRLRISGRRRAGGRVRLAARPVDQVPAIRRRRASKAQVQVSGIRRALQLRRRHADRLGSTVTHALPPRKRSPSPSPPWTARATVPSSPSGCASGEPAADSRRRRGAWRAEEVVGGLGLRGRASAVGDRAARRAPR